MLLILINFKKRYARVILNSRQKFYESEAKFLFSATLAQTFNNRFSALTGAAITVLAFAEPFIAAGAAVGLFAVFLLFFKGAHGLVVPPRHGTFLLQKKD